MSYALQLSFRRPFPFAFVLWLRPFSNVVGFMWASHDSPGRGGTHGLGCRGFGSLLLPCCSFARGNEVYLSARFWVEVVKKAENEFSPDVVTNINHGNIISVSYTHLTLPTNRAASST